MSTKINPFHELYVGESIGPDKFVDLFSDVIVKHALVLFQPGHVILKGLPGTGKSMLLNLLKPSIRIAYADKGQEFPMPKEFRKFIGAGINLKRSGISDFGQRPIDAPDKSELTSPIYFGDFLNYWVVSDIFTTIKKLAKVDSIANEIGIHYSEESLNSLAKQLTKDDCWGGGLPGINNFNEFINSINQRISSYRSFLNFNIDELPNDIKKTKTNIGVPVSKTAELLREYGIISKDVEVYIRIDQYEELAWLDTDTSKLGSTYQEIIHKLLGMRDSSVSYRIGTRHFAWRDDKKKMFGSSARLERKRNYTEVSIDNVLRRKENKRTWVFPSFAEDIFSRRIKLSSYNSKEIIGPYLSRVLGKTISPTQKVLLYLPNSKEKAIRVEEKWPKRWKDFLKDLTEKDPISARFGEAWVRQKGENKEAYMHKKSFNIPYPWNSTPKKWWKKERMEQALIQIASRNQQQLIWYGEDDFLALSGGNILAFLSLCQHVWDVWIRDSKPTDTQENIPLPSFDHVLQSVGIREASADWLQDISDFRGGNERRLFINFLGTHFYKILVEDKAMSYPGHNGFSISKSELEKEKDLYEFLMDASDYGDLYDAPHTSKLNDKKPRHKWYLNPILSPYFKIPYAHTKEPMYTDVQQLKKWLIDSGAYKKVEFEDTPKKKIKKKKENHKDDKQMRLEMN